MRRHEELRHMERLRSEKNGEIMGIIGERPEVWIADQHEKASKD